MVKVYLGLITGRAKPKGRHHTCYLIPLYCNLTLLHMLAVVISNDIQVMSATLFRVMMAVTGSFLLASFHLVGQLAFNTLTAGAAYIRVFIFY